MNTVVIIQARMQSTRLPGKVMMDIAGKPLLYHVVNRLKKCTTLNKVIVATGRAQSNMPIIKFCMQNNIAYAQGDDEDVLDRYQSVAKMHNADVIVRITGDCPLIDPELVDLMVKYYSNNKFDYVGNGHPPTYPDGLDVEIFSARLLEDTWKNAQNKYEREHVTPYMLQTGKYRVGNITNTADNSHLRWIVDYEEDIIFVREIYRLLYRNDNIFTTKDILRVIEQLPHLATINAHIKRNDGFLNSLEKENIGPEDFRDFFKKGLCESEHIYLRHVTLGDATPRYVEWLNDADVNQYLESRFTKQTIETVQKYIEDALNDKQIIFLAIIDKHTGKHIGNIKIGPLSKEHHHADLGIMIGEKEYWGKGYGTEALRLAVKYALSRHNLHKIVMSTCSVNRALARLAERAGFVLEGRLKENTYIEGNYCDTLIYGYTATAQRMLDRSEELWKKAVNLIPLGTQTASKAPDQFAQGAYPKYIQRGKGCKVYDADGNEYIDYPSALGVNILGYSYPAVVDAIKKQAEDGTIFSLMHPLEVEVAEIISKIIPCAEQTRFMKNGADATSAAVRIARSITNREKIACCGYHGSQDWYIISTEKKKGIPKILQEYIFRFEYNNIDSLRKLFVEYPNEIAAVIIEPILPENPKEGFLKEVKEITHENGAILIFDEMVTGFRFGLGGAQQYTGIIPDIACFGKCVANGMPLSFVTGKAEYMSECKNIFQSFTFGGEAISLAAAKATLSVMLEKNVVKHIWEVGKKLQEGLRALQSIGVLFDVTGQPPRQGIAFKEQCGYSAAQIKTLFLQETIKRGILMGNVILPTFSHTEEDIDETLEACKKALEIIKNAIDKKDVQSHLEGDVAQEVFRKKAAEE